MKSESAFSQPQLQTAKKFGTAIVMGASIAGLWTARALIEHFDEVVLIERDHLPEGADYRPGAPQARQYHGLLMSGLQLMRVWFPGLDEELISAGAVPYDIMLNSRVRLPQALVSTVFLRSDFAQLQPAFVGIKDTAETAQNPCIRFVEGVEVVGLQSDEARGCVTGVRVRNRRGSSDPLEADAVYQADFVVDALGRRSKTPEWLREMGYAPPGRARWIASSATSPENISGNQMHHCC